MVTTLEQFNTWKEEGYNFIPVLCEILGDLETPLSIYLKLANQPNSYLLESGYNGKKWGRYSFIGLQCNKRINIKNNEITIIEQNSVTERFISDDPLSFIEALQQEYRAPDLVELPRFNGGFVGYFGYNTIRYIEPRLAQSQNKDVLDVPDIALMLCEQFIIYDNLTTKIYIVVYVNPEQENAYMRATTTITALKTQLQNATIKQEEWVAQQHDRFVANFEQSDYEKQVEKALECFRAGDIMQVILSQRFQKSFYASPTALYRALRYLNPSPYMYYLNLGDFHIVGASPEILVRVEQDTITVRPLAGTRPRGKTPQEDKELEVELLADPKEIAEHLMLIDLGRNDIGRVCEIGSIKLTEQMAIERFSHVMHISSTVIGTIKPGISSLNVLRATFPAGTVSGAPKIRAMEIIDELEHEQRGIYAGAVGYLAWNGNLDMAIALRTALLKNNTVYIQAGAGLVVDSIPELEWQECINKSRALFCAVELAENNLIESHL